VQRGNGILDTARPPPFESLYDGLVMLHDFSINRKIRKALTMPISYDQRKQKLHEQTSQFPPELRKHISLRNIKAAARLPYPDQETLGRALATGLKSQPAAIWYLEEYPGATLDELIQALDSGESGSQGNGAQPPDSNRVPVVTDPDAVHELADVLQLCRPTLYRSAAETLAKADFMSGVLAMVRAWRVCRENQPTQSETVTVALCGLTLPIIAHLNLILKEKPHHREAVRMSGVGEWLLVDWLPVNRFLVIQSPNYPSTHHELTQKWR